MEFRKSEALKKCRPMFIQSLKTTSVLDYLIADGFFSEEECEQIKVKLTPQDKCREFLDMLQKKPSPAYDSFCMALSKVQEYLVEKLQKEYNNTSVQIFRERQNSVDNVNQTLLCGAVPDKPINYIDRPSEINLLTDTLKCLADKFSSNSQMLTSHSPTLETDKLNILSAPTNAWLLVYGMAGSGKSVLTAATLRQNPHLIGEQFLSGVVWIDVGRPDALDSPEIQVKKVLLSLVEYTKELLPTRPTSPPPNEVESLQSYLRRLLIGGPKRRSMVIDDPDASPHLLLVVLDDVWERNVINAVANLPAVFVVTSRDCNILERVRCSVEKVRVEARLESDELAYMIASRTHLSAEVFRQDGVHSHIPPLCRGSPLAANLLGSLLASRSNFLHYIVEQNPSSKGNPIVDWRRITFPSAYPYESVEKAFSVSLEQLSVAECTRYKQFVIFNDDSLQTEETLSLYWSCDIRETSDILQKLVDLSLVECNWCSNRSQHFYGLHNLQLDLLRVSVPPEDQQAYHRMFVENYQRRFGSQWLALAEQVEDHTYFCLTVGEHMLRAGWGQELIVLMTNLEFICALLLVIGPSAVIANFRRYRPIFEILGYTTDLLTYLSFLQTTAHQLVNPDSIVRDIHRRARSPTRPDSLCDITNARLDNVLKEHRNNSLSFERGSFVPDLSPSMHRHQSPSPELRRCGDLRVTSPSQKGGGNGNSKSHRVNLMVKGLDLVQLSFNLSPDNTIFKQSIELLLRDRQSKGNAKPMYWFWSNRSIAESELMWATRTGTNAVTAIAAEVDTSLLSSSLRRRRKSPNDRSVNRQLFGTSDGRIIILDAVSGYEVAVHQVHKPSTLVKSIALLPGCQACLSCGSDGSMIVSTLPPLDSCPIPRHNTPHNRFGNSFFDEEFFDTTDTVDVDDMPFGSPREFLDGASTLDTVDSFGRYGKENMAEDEEDSLTESNKHTWQRSEVHHRCTSPILQEDAFPTYTQTPTVLADLPALFELCRTSDATFTTRSNSQVADKGFESDGSSAQSCIAVSALGTYILFAAPTHAKSEEINEDSKVNEFHQQPIPISMYNVIIGGSNSPTSQSNFTLAKCRDIVIPAQLTDVSSNDQVIVKTATFSLDDSMVLIGLSNGRFWVYSLDEIHWVTCINTSIAMMIDPVFAVPAGTRTPRSSCERSPFHQSTDSDKELSRIAWSEDQQVNACIFLSWPQKRRPGTDELPKGAWRPPNTPFLVAALKTTICVWSLGSDSLDFDGAATILQTKDCLIASSRAQFLLEPPSPSQLLSLDSQTYGDRCLLVAGLRNGQAVVWSLPELCVVFNVCAHNSLVTGVRLSPNSCSLASSDFSPFGHSPLHSSGMNFLVNLITTSSDGLVKAWSFEWPPAKGINCRVLLKNGSLHRCSNWHSRHNSPTFELTLPGRLKSFVLVPPYPLLADLFNVVFGPDGTFLAIGRIKTSCSLQLLNRMTSHPPTPELCCTQLSVSATPQSWSDGDQSDLPEIHSSVPSAAAFSKNMRLVAIGYENGSIHIIELNRQTDPSSFVQTDRLYCQLISDGEKGKIKQGIECIRPQVLLPAYRKVQHIRMWETNSKQGVGVDVIVVAATVMGTVQAWRFTPFEKQVDEAQLLPIHVWPTVPTASGSFGRTRVSNFTWFVLCDNLAPLRSILVNDGNNAVLKKIIGREGLKKQKSTEHAFEQLSWLGVTTGGMVYGRGLGSDWSLQFVAHEQSTITDVDIDPQGNWLATASTDKSCRVWSLTTKMKLYEVFHNSVLIRCVRFRPVVEQTSLGTEVILASGDDLGLLCIWRMTTDKTASYLAASPAAKFRSGVAGCGGSPLFSLCWSPDGRILSGVSDRLCVWTYVRGGYSAASSSNSVKTLVYSGVGGLNPSTAGNFELTPGRVIHVFDSPGSNFSRELAQSMNRLHVGAFYYQNYLPSIIVFDPSSGLLYVFDTVEMHLNK